MTTPKKLRMDNDSRDFGDIPTWAKEGKVNLKNYDLRAELHGAKIREWKQEWPFLSHKAERRATANEHAWDLYFRDHLKGFPPTYQLFRDGIIEYFNVPEATPELFDKSYQPRRPNPTHG